MVNLKITGRVFFKADGAPGATARHKLFLEVFRNTLAPAKLAHSDFSGIAKPISGDFPPITPYDPKCHQWDSLFADITGGSWRMIVAVEFFEFLCGYVAVPENVLDDSARTLTADAPQEFQELWGKVLGGHTFMPTAPSDAKGWVGPRYEHTGPEIGTKTQR